MAAGVAGDAVPRLLTYCPLPYSGKGPARSCVQILSAIPSDILQADLLLPRLRSPVTDSVRVSEALPPILRKAPWRWISRAGAEALDRAMRNRLESCDPARTIAYFWPDPPIELVKFAKKKGVLTVREMINCYTGSSRRLLSEAYAELSLGGAEIVPDSKVEQERKELPLYDYIFASKQVEPTLFEAGVDPERILPSAFGWNPRELGKAVSPPRQTNGVTAIFVGSICVRKGVPYLLEAWRRSGVSGTLLMLGDISPELDQWIAQYKLDPSIKFLGFRNNVGDFFNSADFFIFPTLEEGGPQVTYEAAGCGLPVITTPMGAGRIIEDDVNGLIVESRNVDALQAAIVKFSSSAELRARLGARAREDATHFTYEVLGRQRADLLIGALSKHTRELRVA